VIFVNSGGIWKQWLNIKRIKNISYFQKEEKNIDKLEKPVLSHLFRKANNS